MKEGSLPHRLKDQGRQTPEGPALDLTPDPSASWAPDPAVTGQRQVTVMSKARQAGKWAWRRLLHPRPGLCRGGRGLNDLAEIVTSTAWAVQGRTQPERRWRSSGTNGVFAGRKGSVAFL